MSTVLSSQHGLSSFDGSEQHNLPSSVVISQSSVIANALRIDAILPSQKCTLKANPLLEINSRTAKKPLKIFLESMVQKYRFKIYKTKLKFDDYVNEEFEASENKMLAQKAIRIEAE